MTDEKDFELIWKGKSLIKTKNMLKTKSTLHLEERIDNLKETTEHSTNKLILGDNLEVMLALLPEFEGKINLIYIDPPFGTGESFDYQIFIGNEGEKVSNIVRKRAYKDNWGDGMSSYFQMIYPRLLLMKRLLADDGSIFVHLDRNVSHYIKILLDEIFGPKNLRNEIVWCYGGGGAPKRHYSRKHDIIFWYVKGKEWTFNKQYRPYTEGTLERGCTPVKGKYELNDKGAGLDDWWADAEVQKILSPTAYENVKFETQKPEGLLKRIILGHTNPGDLVADFFMGSGTTLAVAEKLNRRWIGCDISRQTLHVVRKRLLELQHTYDLLAKSQVNAFYSNPLKPFEISVLCQDDDPIEEADFEVGLSSLDNKINVELQNYELSTDNISEEIQEKITHWSDWIDYWAIDINHDPKIGVFKPDWCNYRTIKQRTLKMAAEISINPTSIYSLRIQLVNIFGNSVFKTWFLE